MHFLCHWFCRVIGIPNPLEMVILFLMFVHFVWSFCIFDSTIDADPEARFALEEFSSPGPRRNSESKSNSVLESRGLAVTKFDPWLLDRLVHRLAPQKVSDLEEETTLRPLSYFNSTVTKPRENSGEGEFNYGPGSALETTVRSFETSEHVEPILKVTLTEPEELTKENQSEVVIVHFNNLFQYDNVEESSIENAEKENKTTNLLDLEGPQILDDSEARMDEESSLKPLVRVKRDEEPEVAALARNYIKNSNEEPSEAKRSLPWSIPSDKKDAEEDIDNKIIDSMLSKVDYRRRRSVGPEVKGSWEKEKRTRRGGRLPKRTGSSLSVRDIRQLAAKLLDKVDQLPLDCGVQGGSARLEEKRACAPSSGDSGVLEDSVALEGHKGSKNCEKRQENRSKFVTRAAMTKWSYQPKGQAERCWRKLRRRKRKSKRKWDRWTDWSSCSVTCGRGRQIRWRHCVRNCSNAETEMEEKACQLPACAPGKFLGIFG